LVFNIEINVIGTKIIGHCMMNLLLLIVLIASVCTAGGNEVFKYKQLSFDTPLMRDTNIYNNVPTGLTRHGDRLYVGVARRRLGIPSTLNYIDLAVANRTKNVSPPLVPYPDLTTNTLHVGTLVVIYEKLVV
jgi:hypothetical protein